MSGIRQRRPAGAYRKITDPWIALVRQALALRGWEQKALAAAVGCSGAAISVMLGGKRKSAASRLVDQICDVLAIPGPEFEDAEEADLLATARALRKEDSKYYANMLTLAKNRLRQVRETNKT